MKAEIISVGTELLLGQIVNTNATFLSEQLAQLGIDVYYQTVVGDNEQRLLKILKLAQTRSDLVILSGGLGPTKDDLTKQTVAKLLNKELLYDQGALEKITTFFAKTHQEMAPNNRLQALYFKDAVALKNSEGMAVGIYYAAPDTCDFLLLPGPPNELQTMFLNEAKPLLQKQKSLKSRVLRFFGIGESLLVTKLADLIQAQTNPTIAPYAKTNEVTLRLTASADKSQQAEMLLNDLEEKIQQRVGQYFYGYGDTNSLAQVVVEKLRLQNLTISSAESLTGGLFAKSLTDIAGASAIFPGSFVTYANEAKIALLGIESEIIDKYGVVSQQVACLMATQTQKKLQTDLAVSFTGVAGPDSLEQQAPGTVWIGLKFKDQPAQAKKFYFPKTRSLVREKAVLSALWWIYQEIK